jgi:hypothetical protein
MISVVDETVKRGFEQGAAPPAGVVCRFVDYGLAAGLD